MFITSALNTKRIGFFIINIIRLIIMILAQSLKFIMVLCANSWKISIRCRIFQVNIKGEIVPVMYNIRSILESANLFISSG